MDFDKLSTEHMVKALGLYFDENVTAEFVDMATAVTGVYGQARSEFIKEALSKFKKLNDEYGQKVLYGDPDGIKPTGILNAFKKGD